MASLPKLKCRSHSVLFSSPFPDHERFLRFWIGIRSIHMWGFHIYIYVYMCWQLMPISFTIHQDAQKLPRKGNIRRLFEHTSVPRCRKCWKTDENIPRVHKRQIDVKMEIFEHFSLGRDAIHRNVYIDRIGMHARKDKEIIFCFI